MSNVLYYYAKINENNVCYGFETLPKKFKQEDLPSNLVPLVDYNETVLWKKWDRELKAWSSERYEPETNFELLERIDSLEEENANLQNGVNNLQGTISELNMTNEILTQSIAELTAMIAMLQAPTE